MASFDWTKINPAIGIKDTRKKFFSRYYYSARYSCPGGRIISNCDEPGMSQDDIIRLLEVRKENYKVYNYSGSWRATRERIDGIDQEQLIEFFRVRAENVPNIRFRIEEPYIKLYAETEDALYRIASRDLFKWRSELLEIQKPASVQALALLDTNAIITRKPNGYTYKVVLRDGRYSASTKANLLQYLTDLGELVQMSKTVVRHLKSKGDYIWGVWLYTNDQDIVTMLNLIAPGAVSNIHTLVTIEK